MALLGFSLGERPTAKDWLEIIFKGDGGGGGDMKLRLFGIALLWIGIPGSFGVAGRAGDGFYPAIAEA